MKPTCSLMYWITCFPYRCFVDGISNSETPTLNRMKTGYGLLCMMRKNGEMGTCSAKIFDQFQRGTIEFTSVTNATNYPNARIMYAGLQNFFSASFEDFKKLNKRSQRLVVFNNFNLFNKIDAAYRSVHHFSDDDDIIMPSYTTVLSVDRMDEYLIDCPPGVNKQEAAAVISMHTRQNILTFKPHFKRIRPTGEELLAILGLALWDENTWRDDEEMIEIVKRNRSTIMAELHQYYATRGRNDYADRLGDVLCLLVHVEEAATKQKEDDKVYALMNLFNEYVTEPNRSFLPK
ncbi:hypothetical protein PENTCL1PPCAC_20684 [Pristionchus entomophagus]|uniref:NR LBD domain-containing protein n=1 Tax=Pristionchus entomophagus TaxID=358040 RepID=A0AAV5TW79_9BILA|nr:hypothetical protein PENTCL1PPCAC_20684 [Pristionchus entomophagus]